MKPEPPTLADMPGTMPEALRAFIGYVSPRVLLLLLLAVLALRVYVGHPGWGDLLAAAIGFAIWPLLEWTLHRYVLHLRPFTFAGREWDMDFAKKHRQHHMEPWRPELIFLPGYLHMLFAPVLLALAWFVAPDRGLGLSVLAGFVMAALNYEWTHYLVHSRVQPKNRYYRRLFRHHRMHHFRNEHYWFGFTVTGIDRMLGTGPEPETVSRSDSCRGLGVT